MAFPDPGNDGAIIKADDQLHPNRDLAFKTFNDADDVGIGPARRHEIDIANGAVVSLDFGFENERVAPIAAVGPCDRGFRDKAPVAVVSRA